MVRCGQEESRGPPFIENRERQPVASDRRTGGRRLEWFGDGLVHGGAPFERDTRVTGRVCAG